MSADTEVTNTIARWALSSACCCTNSRATACVRKYGPCRLVRSDFLEAFLGGREQIGAHAWRAAGVVHERVQRAEVRDDRREQMRAVVRAADVGRPVLGAAAERLRALSRRRRPLHATADRKGERPALARERARDAEADAARAAGHQCDAIVARCLVVAGPHPRHLYLATFGRSTMVDDLPSDCHAKNVKYRSPSAMRFT